MQTTTIFLDQIVAGWASFHVTVMCKLFEIVSFHMIFKLKLRDTIVIPTVKEGTRASLNRIQNLRCGSAGNIEACCDFVAEQFALALGAVNLLMLSVLPSNVMADAISTEQMSATQHHLYTRI
jgi:hypothetical protein